MANTTNTNKYLRPWSTVDDEELRLLRMLEAECVDLKGRDPAEVLYMHGGGTLNIGLISQILLALEKVK